MFAARTRRVQLSSTFRVAGLARDLRSRGVDVVDFSVGEPDFATPTVVKEAGKRAIDRDVTRYTANEGTVELRRAIAAKLLADNGLRYEVDEILVSPGAKASLYCAAMALYDEGDEVIIPCPCWVSHPEQVRLAGATPVFVHGSEDNEFKITPDQLHAAITPRSKAVILNYPSNPTGACYDRDELAELARVCLDHRLVVVADEIYEKLLFDGRTFTSIASTSEEMKNATVIVNGLSKSFAMTGWRVGYAAAPRAIIAEMAKVQSHSSGHPSSISQVAGLEALGAAGGEVAAMARQFEARRDAVVELIRAVPGWGCVRPAGAFYAFPNVSAELGQTRSGRVIATATDLAMVLLETAHVAVVPGEAFEAPHHIRISFACSMERIAEGMRRIAEVLA